MSAGGLRHASLVGVAGRLWCRPRAGQRALGGTMRLMGASQAMTRARVGHSMPFGAADGQRSEGRFARPCPRSRPPCSRRARVDAGAGPEGSARAGLGMRVRGRPSALTSRWRREAKDNKDGLPTGTITDGRPSLARSDVPPHRDISSARPEQPLSYAPPTNVLRYAAHSFNSSRLSFQKP